MQDRFPYLAGLEALEDLVHPARPVFLGCLAFPGYLVYPGCLAGPEGLAGLAGIPCNCNVGTALAAAGKAVGIGVAVTNIRAGTIDNTNCDSLASFHDHSAKDMSRDRLANFRDRSARKTMVNIPHHPRVDTDGSMAL